MSAIDLTAYFTPLIPESICRLRQLVEMESHSADKGAVDALAAHLAGMFEAEGGTPELLSCPSHGNTLRVSWRAGTKANAGPVLLLGHLDTVWPQGTTRARPFRVEKEKAFGPGVYDMKAGLLLSWLVARALQDGASRPGRDVLFLFTGDEEIGTAEGLPHLKQAARGCAAVLCLEPPLAGGKAKTFRKGVGCFRLQVTGLSAHAGVEPEKGADAILELSRQVLRLHELNDKERGTTVTVGVIKGGTASNVVPSEAEAEIDVRVASAEEGSSIEARIGALKPHDPRCKLRVEGGLNRPPLERTPAVVELYLKARSAALELGMDLGEGGTGGGSDGSFTAAMGIPTLDGLGVEGGGAHAPHEYIEIGDIPRRAALLCRLLETIG